jgi:stage IV sporulation protein FB
MGSNCSEPLLLLDGLLSQRFLMQDHAAWSLNLGQWWGLRVRLHAFFLLFIACAMLLKWYFASQTADLDWMIPVSLVLLFFSVIVHEAGHVWTVRRHGGGSDLIVLGPLGGMVPVQVIGNPRAEFRAHLAGPFANLLVCAICVAILQALGSTAWGLLNPLSPTDLATGTILQVVLKLMFWINWTLLLINLIPAFPLDAAFAMRSLILDRWPMVRPAQATLMVARTGQTLAGLLALAAVFGRFHDHELFVPIRLSLMVFAILLFLAARQRRFFDESERSDQLLLAYELTGDLDVLERDLRDVGHLKSGPLTRWFHRRRQIRLQRQEINEQEEEQRVDEILSRLHESGMQSLSKEDKALLNRVSIRYRNRQGR